MNPELYNEDSPVLTTRYVKDISAHEENQSSVLTHLVSYMNPHLYNESFSGPYTMIRINTAYRGS